MDALQPYRDAERDEDLTVLLGSQDAARLCSVWRHLAAPWAPPDGEQPEDLGERWRWLWGNVFVDPTTLARTSGVALVRVSRLFGALRRMRLIYPDGSLHDGVRKYLASRARQQIGDSS